MRISLLVPYRPNKTTPNRARTWKWLQKYWKHELPDAEVIVGHSCSTIFSKSEAINDAARRATGDVFVIIDSDAYLSGETIRWCADTIRESRRVGHPVWFMPYRALYRLTEQATEKVLTSNPKKPYRFPDSVDPIDVESTVGTEVGHYFGAMIQIMPREAFEAVGCWDPRYAGWGAEDISFLMAVDTLWGKHKSVDASVFHLWHPVFKTAHPHARLWEGQDRSTHSKLAERYRRANGDYDKMRVLVDEGCDCSQECMCEPQGPLKPAIMWGTVLLGLLYWVVSWFL